MKLMEWKVHVKFVDKCPHYLLEVWQYFLGELGANKVHWKVISPDKFLLLFPSSVDFLYVEITCQTFCWTWFLLGVVLFILKSWFIRDDSMDYFDQSKIFSQIVAFKWLLVKYWDLHDCVSCDKTNNLRFFYETYGKRTWRWKEFCSKGIFHKTASKPKIFNFFVLFNLNSLRMISGYFCYTPQCCLLCYWLFIKRISYMRFILSLERRKEFWILHRIKNN
jgi:hypothetical protein